MSEDFNILIWYLSAMNKSWNFESVELSTICIIFKKDDFEEPNILRKYHHK